MCFHTSKIFREDLLEARLRYSEKHTDINKNCLSLQKWQKHGVYLYTAISIEFYEILASRPGRVAQSVARLTQEPEVSGSIPGPATYFRFSFR